MSKRLGIEPASWLKRGKSVAKERVSSLLIEKGYKGMTTEGEENSKFFQAMEIGRFRRNTISRLVNEDGMLVSSHSEMAGLLWSSYRIEWG